MKITDAHCDTLSAWAEGEASFFKEEETNQDYLQVFALFGGITKTPRGRVEKQIEVYHARKSILPCQSILAMEGAHALEGDPQRLIGYHEKGVRVFGPMWNDDNAFGCGCDTRNDTGLTKKGEELLVLAERLGMTVDLAHASEKTFFDALRILKTPPIVSHACAKKLCNHRRNLSDDQLRALASAGGVLGICFWDEIVAEHAQIRDVISQIEYCVSVMGADFVGFGSDTDGVDNPMEDLRSPGDIRRLAENLKTYFSVDIAEKIAGGNFMRLFSQHFEQEKEDFS
ncbi:MAG: membrane dipeptidase [Clostridia bacterium]|nr:membrane dipeptidase [Clostridia bacterium]